MTNHKSKMIVGTRGSALAQWQTNYITAALRRIAPDLRIETRIIRTSGDQDQTHAFVDLGGRGAFTKEIENALLAREIDLAVHSLKDLPTDAAPGLTIGAIPAREDARDCLVSRHGIGLRQLPYGARIGTSSARRTAQLLALRADAHIVPLRGNVDTRLRKSQSGEYDAVVLAAAGLTRLGRANEITEYLALEDFLPDPGQGALAVEIRAEEVELAELVSQLDHAPTRAAATAERAVLRALGGGCRTPVGAFAELRGEQLHLCAMIASDDGTRITRGEIDGEVSSAEELGMELARKLAGGMWPVTSDRRTASPDPGRPLPFQGKRILITRARDQANELAEKIRARGGEPIEFPTIDFTPLGDFDALDQVLLRVNDFDWIVFTSANGVRFVADRMKALGLARNRLALKHIAAIGPATARALQALGLRVSFIPTKFLGEQIAVELPIERGQRALLLRADLASDQLARGLQARGVMVADIDAYRTVMPAAPAIDLPAIDAITFTSSSTVKNFVAMQKSISPAQVFCIGPVTADTARELGLRVDAVAAEHTLDGLVNAMMQYYESAGPSGNTKTNS